MFTLRRFFYKAETFPGSEIASEQKLPTFGDSEKATLFNDFVPLQPPKHYSKHGKLRSVGKLFVLSFVLAFALFSSQSLRYHTNIGYDALLRNNDAQEHVMSSDSVGIDKPISVSAAPWTADPVGAEILSRSNWDVNCSSIIDAKHGCELAFDGNDKTYWKSAEESGRQWVEIDLKRKVNVHSLAVAPIQKKFGGFIRKHIVEVATERGNWDVVATGTWRNGYGQKFATFEPRLAQFVRLTILDTWLERKYVTINEINIYTAKTVEAPVVKGGRWNVTLNFPLVPVTVFLDPKTQNVITMASYKPDDYDAEKERFTFSAMWDVKTGEIEERILNKTAHDMFCPGTSLDERGRVLVTGGSTPDALSIYDPVGESFYTPTDNSTKKPTVLKIPRGYQGQTFMPNGKTFTVGGGWSGADATVPRGGEVFDPVDNTTRELKNVGAEPLMMDPSVTCDGKEDPCYREDWRQFHMWLFAWKKNTIFHAGPSKRMNWIFTEPHEGLVEHAGVRGDHGDAVCAIISMYDAENGVILAAGGAPNYNYWYDAENTTAGAGHRLPATNKAFEIKLGGVEPGDQVQPTEVASMIHQRIFANAVILPNGETFVVGGQLHGEPFWDETWQDVPEIYSPDTQTWREVARHSTPRVYHSWAMLLPDASVLVGGSGLHRWQTDHYDAQIYQPSYLFEADGKTYAKRPKIKSVNTQIYKVGDKITITTDVPVDAASLIRYSATTHTVNNDLRRIKLTPTSVDSPADNKYTVQIPDDPGVALPGYWILFVLAEGVPSHGETVQILAE